ncbi:MAG: DegT/DnrJ/EryC1/StrS family aminotransferase [Deltaproteobacteria bacterium]|nr:DegT/DnrJ/EryC1/StrS family aminotransferase [Deltaproteobacteria bacterium]
MPGPGFYLFGDEERKEVLDVLETGYLSRYGQESDPRFKHKVVTLEQEFAKKIGVKHALATNGGTSSIIAALIALGVGRGDEVLVPGYTYVASISAVIAVGGTPILAEVDESLTMDPSDIEHRISSRTKAIMPVHMLGNPSDIDGIMAVARKHKIPILEDACQSLGASYKGKRTGVFGAINAFSLNINKTITTGDAGMVTTDDDELYERAFGYHDQGHKRLGMGLEISARSRVVGVNLRINELTGAVGLAQLHKLDTIVALLREKKRKFKEAIEAGGIRNMSYRRINDPGEIATILTVLFPDEAVTRRVAAALGVKIVSDSGWHVYNHMEQILSWHDEQGRRPNRKNMLTKTDAILSRALNLSVGVVDPGIGANFGINVLSSDQEIARKAEEFVKKVKPIVG